MIIDGHTAHQSQLDTTGPQSSMACERAPAVAVDPAARSGETIAFGPFQLLARRRLLLRSATPVRLGSRALEILIALTDRPGELVSKTELMARVWPDTFVEEGNLKVQVAGLRRALGDNGGASRYVATVPGRGYRFVAPTTRTDEATLRAARAAAPAVSELPAPITHVVDRVDSIEALSAQLSHHRFITIVGPGGIGKTTVAIRVARQLAGSYGHDVRFVDLARLAERGGQLPSVDLLLGPGTELTGRSGMLVVLDNCEHVIEAAADLAVELLNREPGLQVLATSREPLRTEGEHVHRLAPLACPPASIRPTAEQALRFAAVELFVERATATSDEFTFGDQDAAIVADICRTLDGVPLAIELAAARIDVFGLHGLAVRLRDPLQLLTGGRRAALPRHRTMRATLEWSHDLLCETERKVLRRLAILGGGFTLEAAAAIAACAEIGADEVVEHVATLVSKSLIVADLGGAAPRYRLLGTTRAFALEKLDESGDAEQAVRRHAAYGDAGAAHEGERAGCLTAKRLAGRGRRIGTLGGPSEGMLPRPHAHLALLHP